MTFEFQSAREIKKNSLQIEKEMDFLIDFKKHRRALLGSTAAILLWVIVIAFGIPAVLIWTGALEMSFDLITVSYGYVQIYMALFVLQATFAALAVCARLKLLNRALR